MLLLLTEEGAQMEVLLVASTLKLFWMCFICKPTLCITYNDPSR